MNETKQLDSDKKIVVEVAEEGEVVAESRRKFIKAAGKLSIYTPPAMMLLMNPSVEAFANSGNGNGNCGKKIKKKDKKKYNCGGGNG